MSIEGIQRRLCLAQLRKIWKAGCLETYMSGLGLGAGCNSPLYTTEYGKETFRTKMGREIGRVKERYPNVYVTGLGDGAKDNWSFLERYSDRLVIDFWHVSGYVHKVADA